MAKTSVNLIIRKDADSPFVRRLKRIVPVLGITSIVLFLILFLISLAYLNSNTARFNQLKSEIGQLEKKISGQKTNESTYILTASLLTALQQISSKDKDFSPLLSEILGLKSIDISVPVATVDKDYNVSFGITASSSATLDTLVTRLQSLEAKKYFSEIRAYGIVRDKKGKYNLNISLKTGPVLLK